MELTWLPDTPQSRSRARAPRACSSCQRRKKRCRHAAAQYTRVDNAPYRWQIHNLEENHDVPDDNRSPRGTAADKRSTTPSTERAPQEYSRPERFVGDLNPEAVIRQRLDADSENPLRNRIGLWVSSSGAPSDDGHRKYFAKGAALTNHPSQTPLDSSSTTALLNQRYMSTMSACVRLPAQTLRSLVPIYFSKVNRILPLVDETSFLHAHGNGTASVFLERAICLVAAKHKMASPSLYLANDESFASSRQFCSDVYKGLVGAMDVALEPDRVTRIRVLALMSLHCEGYEGEEAASMHLCHAIHQSQTAGLHHARPGRTDRDSLSKLFWCLWTLDKMHACIGGRPILLADRDIGLEKPDLKAPRPRSAFDVWFAISDLLATVISYYRPSADGAIGWEEGFPSFEEIVGDTVRGELDFTTLGCLELYYHAVSILSCRSNLADLTDGSKPSYIRQGLAAIRIYSIVASECTHDLPPLPVVPYAVALSMGVSYQQFRSSKLITHFDRAKTGLVNCCSLLEELSTYWVSAEAMARLGQKALHQIEARREGLPHSEESRHGDSSERMGVRPGDSAPATPVPTDANRPHGSSKRRRSTIELPSIPVTQDNPVLGPSGVPLAGPEGFGQDGFADIDMLFGDFLDLSLPTNFWDPVFTTEEQGGI